MMWCQATSSWSDNNVLVAWSRPMPTPSIRWAEADARTSSRYAGPWYSTNTLHTARLLARRLNPRGLVLKLGACITETNTRVHHLRHAGPQTDAWGLQPASGTPVVLTPARSI